jgi:hypothetical protein
MPGIPGEEEPVLPFPFPGGPRGPYTPSFPSPADPVFGGGGLPNPFPPTPAPPRPRPTPPRAPPPAPRPPGLAPTGDVTELPPVIVTGQRAPPTRIRVNRDGTADFCQRQGEREVCVRLPDPFFGGFVGAAARAAELSVRGLYRIVLDIPKIIRRPIRAPVRPKPDLAKATKDFEDLAEWVARQRAAARTVGPRVAPFPILIPARPNEPLPEPDVIAQPAPAPAPAPARAPGTRPLPAPPLEVPIPTPSVPYPGPLNVPNAPTVPAETPAPARTPSPAPRTAPRSVPRPSVPGLPFPSAPMWPLPLLRPTPRPTPRPTGRPTPNPNPNPRPRPRPNPNPNPRPNPNPNPNPQPRPLTPSQPTALRSPGPQSGPCNCAPCGPPRDRSKERRKRKRKQCVKSVTRDTKTGRFTK